MKLNTFTFVYISSVFFYTSAALAMESKDEESKDTDFFDLPSEQQIPETLSKDSRYKEVVPAVTNWRYFERKATPSEEKMYGIMFDENSKCRGYYQNRDPRETLIHQEESDSKAMENEDTHFFNLPREQRTPETLSRDSRYREIIPAALNWRYFEREIVTPSGKRIYGIMFDGNNTCRGHYVDSRSRGIPIQGEKNPKKRRAHPKSKSKFTLDSTIKKYIAAGLAMGALIFLVTKAIQKKKDPQPASSANQ